jgi:hypothetical protein
VLSVQYCLSLVLELRWVLVLMAPSLPWVLSVQYCLSLVLELG